MTSAQPIPDDVLDEKVRALAAETGTWPSRRAVMRACGVGAPRAQAALDKLRAQEFDPSPTQIMAPVPAEPEVRAEPEQQETVATTIDAEPVAEPVVEREQRQIPRWPLLIIAMPAFVAVWSGWVGLGKLTGFGEVALLPGIADGWVIDTAVTLPIGVEVYAAYAMWIWLSGTNLSRQARRFARWSALGSLVLGAAGQGAYHLMTAAGMTTAPWPITAGVSCLPVLVIGCAVALVHLTHTAPE